MFVILLINYADCWAQVEAKLIRLGSTTHLELKGKDQWNYEINKTQEGKKTVFSMRVPELSAAANREIAAFKMEGLEKIQINEGPDRSSILKFTFGSPNVDHFDYLTDRPSRLVVDFYPQTLDSVAQTEPKLKPAAAVKRASPSEPSIARKPAASDAIRIVQDSDPNSDLTNATKETTALQPKPQAKTQFGIFDGADPEFSRFLTKDYEIREEAIIASKQNVYVDFPILRIKPDELSILESRMPVYNIEPKDTEENKQARLLLTLFQNKRYNVFLTTAQWFAEKFPKSEYLDIVEYIWGDAYYTLWRQGQKVADLDMAIVKYESAMRKFPNTPMAERTAILVAYARLERGDNLGALQLFQSYLSQFPQSKNRDLGWIAMAEANYNLNRYPEALHLYDQVMNQGLRQDEKVRAAFLKGDVYYKSKDDKLAIAEYRKVLAQYPTESEEYPGAYFNLAAALFRTGQFKESLVAQVDFVKNFPSHPFSGFAMTRVGEILEILGADPSRVIGAYLETYFRYGETEGAIVARLRLLSARMKAMKVKEVDKAIKDIMKLANDSALPKMQQFATIMVADGYHSRKEFDRSTSLLVKYYQENPTAAESEILLQRIVRNISDQIHDHVEKTEFTNALQVHQKYATNWLKSARRIDLKYNLGRAFEQAGVFKEAEKLYRDTLNRLMAIKGTRAEKETGVFERIPKRDEISLRMASVNVARGQFADAIQNLRNIERPEELKEIDQVERVVLAAQLYDKKGEPQTAVRYLTELIRTWRGIPALVAEPYLQLGEMEAQMKQKDSAISSFNRVDELMRDSGQVSEATHIKALEKMAELQLEVNKHEAAAQTYQRLLDLYEKKRPMASLRFRLGNIYFERGEIKKAEEVWKNFEGDKTGFWAKVAQERLKSSEWSDEYRKYLKRIPAMSQQPQENKL